MSHELVYVDEVYDREMASDGGSRYGAYLRRSRLLAGADEEPLDAVEFAAEAWRIACSPVMSPGYVRTAEEIYAVECRRGLDEPDALVVETDLRLPHTRTIPGGKRLLGWRDWCRARLSGDEATFLTEPDEQVSALLFTARLQMPVRIEDLPAPATTGLTDVEEAKAAVAVVVAEINTHLGPAVADLRDVWGVV